MQVAALLFAAAFVYLASQAAGKLLLQVLRVDLYRSEEYFVGFVLGASLLSTMVFGLTAAHLAYGSVFIAAGGAILALAVWRGAHRFSEKRLPPLARPWQIGFGLLYAAFAMVYLEAALLPEAGSDAVLYHVALPGRYLAQHSFPSNTRNMMANLSEGVEMLFLFAYPIAKQSAGAMVHLLFTLATPWGMLSYGRRVGRPAVGVAGALLFFMSPVVGKLGTTGYIDVAVASVLFAVYYLLEIWREDRSTRLLAAVGILAGFCYASKYTALLAVPYAMALIIYECWRGRRPMLRPIMLTALCAFAVMLPYLVKNTLVVGNPVAPFGNRFFPNRLLTVSQENTYANVMRHWGGVRLSEVPLETTLRGGRLQGVIGPVFLLAPLALLALRSSPGRRLLLAFAFFSLTYFASIATRFLVPMLPFLAIALACALPRILLPIVVLAHALLSWPTVVPRYCDPGCWRLHSLIWQVALRQRPESDFLRENLPDYEMGLVLDKIVPPGEAVFAYGGFQQAYQSHEIIVSWQSIFGKNLADALETPVVKDRLPTWRHAYQFRELGVRKLRLVQQSASADEEWSVTELRVLRSGVELPRSPQWRLRASPNPWTIQAAFDNNRTTRWTSGQPLSPGMWLEVDFGKSENLDSVMVECTGDQSQAPFRLEVENASGAWLEPAPHPAVYERRAPNGLRAAAVDELKRNHVFWILILDVDAVATDFADNAERWGVKLVASEEHCRLYHLN